MDNTSVVTNHRRPAARLFESSEHVEAALAASSYLPDHGLATVIYLATNLQRPLLLEGEPGVGKTRVAAALAAITGRDLIRLQCYEGIEASEALYDWDYRRQLLVARSADEAGDEADLYSARFLLERPLLRAVRSGAGAVLLVDEIDRADDQFEAFLLEFLSEFTVTIPELGTIAAVEPPVVVITSNRTRELHDALARRCLYHWIDYPDVEREAAIIRLQAPEVTEELARSVAEAVAVLRGLDLVKPPGAAESIDWARSLALVGVESVRQNLDAVRATLGAVLKNHDDVRAVVPQLPGIVGD
jgi:MoxR-like ATPase